MKRLFGFIGIRSSTLNRRNTSTSSDRRDCSFDSGNAVLIHRYLQSKASFLVLRCQRIQSQACPEEPKKCLQINFAAHKNSKSNYEFSVLDAVAVSWFTFETRIKKAGLNGKVMYENCKKFANTTSDDKGMEGVLVTVYPAFNDSSPPAFPRLFGLEEIAATEVNEHWQVHKYKYLKVCISSILCQIVELAPSRQFS
jgi:hypothetical protein